MAWAPVLEDDVPAEIGARLRGDIADKPSTIIRWAVERGALSALFGSAERSFVRFSESPEKSGQNSGVDTGWIYDRAQAIGAKHVFVRSRDNARSTHRRNRCSRAQHAP